MTLIVSWVATDDKPGGKKISALYFCSDSRFSWEYLKKRYDMGKKVYACNAYPEIFCFCGDVGFPSTSLQSLITEIDRGVLFARDSSFEQKRDIIKEFLTQSVSIYPKEVLAQSYSIYYASCIKENFYMVKYLYNSRELCVENLILPSVSSIAFSDGLGKSIFDEMWDKSNRNDVNEQHTSRNVYNCFVRTIDAVANCDSNIRNTVGGAPQLVGLYRNGRTQLFGIIKKGKRFINGREIEYNSRLNNIEWRNDNFERVDPQTMKLLDGAQPQPFAHRR